MNQYYLNLGTALFEENRYDGLLVCDINWAGTEDDSRPTQDLVDKSFFSDERFFDNGGRRGLDYRRRIVGWIGSFGHPLAARDPGPFERSIVQTNWRYDQSPSASQEGKADPAALAAHWDNFAFHITTLRPRLLFFMGTSLHEALVSPHCRSLAQGLLGKPSEDWPWKNNLLTDGKEGVAIGIQMWERLQVVSLPHPSRRTWSDEYIASFRDSVSPIIAEFKRQRGFVP